MRTNNWMRHLAWGVLGLVTQQVFPQVTIDNNNGQGGAFVGWNAGANQILEVKNEANQPIEWYSHNLRRMLLNQTLTGQTVNGYNPVDLTGNLGVGLFNTPGPNAITRPLTLLHLDDGSDEDAGFRSWMHTGVTMTQYSDLMYVGLKHESDDINSATIVWSDNFQGATAGPDRLRFIFTYDNAGPSVAGSVEGLEIARMIPANDGNEGFLGIGDWQSAGVNPNERLDLLDGRARIRRLPDVNGEATGLYKVMVVDDTPSPSGERGVVKWVDPNDLPAASLDCDWTMQTSNSVSTAYAGNSGCPQFPDGVGVGLQEPKAKLHVYYDHSEGDNIMGNASILGEHRADEITGLAVHGNAQPWIGFNPNFAGVANDQSSFPSLGTSRTYTGVLGTAGAGMYCIGVEGVAANADEGIAKDLLGVVGRSLAEESSVRCVGVYGFAKGAESGNDWAGWFDGLTFCTTGVFQASDAQLKTNIEALSGATAILSELEPKTYEFNIEEYPFLGTDAGRHHGLLADDLAEVVPGAVREAVRPEQYDNDGVLVASELAFKAVNYQELIPILIAGFNEQRERIDRLESQLAACCSDPDGGRANSQGTENGLLNDAEIDRKLQIIPNPFQTETTIHYNLERGGRVQLMANSADGKQLQVLYEQVSESGVYQFNWHTEDLAAGMYYVTLLLDGEPITKRVVKITH